VLKIGGYWYIAAPSAELQKQPIRRVVEGETLVLFRDGSERPHALVDRCAHRGMALSQGRVIQDCIQCPYHGWKYDGTGRLREVPALCTDETLPQAKSMRTYPVREQEKHLWVWIGEDEPTRDPFHFPHYGEEGWNTFFMHNRFEAPVDMCLENFLDVPHTIFVHPGLFRNEDQQPTRARIRRFADSVEAEFLNEKPMAGIGPRLVFPRGTVMKHADRFILPSISRVDYGYGTDAGFVITSQCTQREEYAVDVTTAIAWKLPLPTWIAGPFLRWYCNRVIQQDVEVLKIQGAQLKEFGRSFTHTSADLIGRHILALRRRAAEGGEALEEISLETELRI